MKQKLSFLKAFPYSKKCLCLFGILTILIIILWCFFSKNKKINSPSTIEDSQNVSQKHTHEQEDEKSQEKPAVSSENESSATDASFPESKKKYTPSECSEKEICLSIDKLISQRNFPEALQLAEYYLVLKLKSSERERVLLYKGNLLFATGQLQEAYQIYDQLLKEGQREDVRSWSVVKLYVLARQLNRLDETMTKYQELMNLYQNDLRLMSTMADLYAYQHLDEQEIKIRSKIFNQHPDSLENADRLITVLAKAKKYSSAAAVAADLAAIDSKNQAKHLLAQAGFLYHTETKEEAASVCEKIFASPSADYRNLLHCGYLYEKLNYLQKAIMTFTKAAELSTEQYQKERCVVEILRVKQLSQSLSDEDLKMLEDLAVNARAGGVRQMAANVLSNDKGKME